MSGYLNTRWDMMATSSDVSVSSSGDNEIVPAAANAKIRVYAHQLIARGSVLGRMESGPGGDALTGQRSMADTTGWVMDLNEDGWYETNEGESLSLELSGAVSVDGVIKYRYIYKHQ